MPLTQSLDHFHRYLTGLWSDISDRPNGLSCSEYGYLRAIERLDGEKLAGASFDHDHCQSSEEQGHHLQELVEVLKIRKASASVAITKLEKRGLVARFPCQRDARAQHIILTEKAKEYLRLEEAVYQHSSRDIERVLSPEELATFKACLEKLNQKL